MHFKIGLTFEKIQMEFKDTLFELCPSPRRTWVPHCRCRCWESVRPGGVVDLATGPLGTQSLPRTVGNFLRKTVRLKLYCASIFDLQWVVIFQKLCREVDFDTSNFVWMCKKTKISYKVQIFPFLKYSILNSIIYDTLKYSLIWNI